MYSTRTGSDQDWITLMRRALFVSPHFPPTNAADMHRVRLLLPYMRQNGWEVEVLAVVPDSVAAPRDEWLVGGLPSDIPVHRVIGLGLAWSGIPGFGTLGFRALPAIRRSGDKLLKLKQFDLVYFSTTQWPVHLAGPSWKKRLRVPFVMDYQDPWVSSYYADHPEVRPPGGRIKYRATSMLNSWMEPYVLKHCSGITSVSEAYPIALQRNYPKIAQSMRSLVRSFPADASDLLSAKRNSTDQHLFDPSDGLTHWVYIGRAGEDMHRALHCFFAALRTYGTKNSKWMKNLRMHFIGTSYAARKGIPTVSPIADQYGLSHHVIEQTDRVPYSTMLSSLKQADALLVIGSDDPSYTASKVYPYLLAEKPMLAIFHEASGIVDLLKNVGGSVLATFANDRAASETEHQILSKWFQNEAFLRTIPLDRQAFQPYCAVSQAADLAVFFESLLDGMRHE